MQSFRGPQVCRLAGVTYRQLDYWSRTGILEPSIASAHGSGSQRLYSAGDVKAAATLRALRSVGFPLQRLRDVADRIRATDAAYLVVTSDGDLVGAAGEWELGEAVRRHNVVTVLATAVDLEEMAAGAA